MARQPKGFVLYKDDLETLNEMLEASEAFAVILALSEYATSGEKPEKGDLTPAAHMAFAMMSRKIDDAMAKYADVSEKRANAAKASKESKTSNCMQNEQLHANAAKAANETEKKVNESDLEIESESEIEIESDLHKKEEEKRACARVTAAAAPHEDLTAQIEANQQAEQLIRRYKLPCTEVVLEALLEDGQKYGFEKVEDALKKASLSDNRQGLSVNFYRAVLTGAGKKAARATRNGDHMQRHEYTDEDFRNMAIDLDEEIEKWEAQKSESAIP